MIDKEKLVEDLLEKMEEILNSDEIMRRTDEINELVRIVEDAYDIQKY